MVSTNVRRMRVWGIVIGVLLVFAGVLQMRDGVLIYTAEQVMAPYVYRGLNSGITEFEEMLKESPASDPALQQSVTRGLDQIKRDAGAFRERYIDGGAVFYPTQFFLAFSIVFFVFIAFAGIKLCMGKPSAQRYLLGGVFFALLLGVFFIGSMHAPVSFVMRQTEKFSALSAAYHGQPLESVRPLKTTSWSLFLEFLRAFAARPGLLAVVVIYNLRNLLILGIALFYLKRGK